MENELIEDVKSRLRYLEACADNLVIDGDVHLSDIANIPDSALKELAYMEGYYHGKPIDIEIALANMQMAGVDMCLVWQNPSVTVYRKDADYNFKSLLAANRYIYGAVKAYPDKFIPGGWVDPKATSLDQTYELIRIFVHEFGFPIVKVNPAQNQFMIDSDVVFKVLDKIYEFGAIPAFHFGSDTPFTPVAGLERVVQYAQNRPVLAIHMGGGGASYVEADDTYIRARELGLKYDNLKYVLSAKRDTHIESDLIAYQLKGAPYSSNLICASDAPYGNMCWNFGGFRSMFDSFKSGSGHPDIRLKQHPDLFNDQSIAGFMGGNMAQLAISGYKSILNCI